MTTGSRPLHALALPPTAAVAEINRIWDRGEAVLPLDPRAPGAALRRQIETLRPTHLVDADGRSRMPDGEPVEDGIAAVVTTSGTSGTPKGVELTEAGIEASARAVSAALGAGPADRWLLCVPSHAVAGLAIVARVRHTGASLVVHDRFDPAKVAAGDGATWASLVATMLARVLDTGAACATTPSVLLGGGPVPPGLLDRARAAGVHVTISYGMTETFGGCVLDRRPVEGVELRLAGDGEVLLRGPVLPRRYRGDAEATAAVLRGGWLHTGDLGELDAEGRLHVTGRKRELIITGGVNVQPGEVERVLSAHPGVDEVGVAGLPDPEWGERVVAWVVPADPADPPDLTTLRGFARDRLPAAKLPRQVVVVEALPRTGSGKLRRRLLPGLGTAGRTVGPEA